MNGFDGCIHEIPQQNHQVRLQRAGEIDGFLQKIELGEWQQVKIAQGNNPKPLQSFGQTADGNLYDLQPEIQGFGQSLDAASRKKGGHGGS